ncbi:MAG: RNA polymerase sigma factor [Clostridia bacterium]|nr:RNA polymerase sigma factor [Clostridia bacterium]
MQEVFEQKYKECEKSLFLVALGYLHSTEDAEDCVQDAVLSAIKSFDSLKNKEYFKTWLTRIVINKCKDYLKKQKFTEELTDNLNVFYDIPLEETELLDCICKLSTKLSVYITLRFYNDMTYEEVARTLKVPVSTVKYKTKKALNELKNLLEGDALNENI